jgi:hypothetical protein
MPPAPPVTLPPSHPSGPPAAVCQPEAVFTGEPIAANDKWTWVDFPDAFCRDGSTTGIGVRLHPGSKKVAIYLEGGGACFHPDSCNINALFANFNGSSFSGWAGGAGASGIFDATRTDNPFADWNMVYVPYCTGDVHAGNREHVDVPGNSPKDQMFVGFRNVSRYLQRLVPTFADATDVVLTGISAGGFGAAFNYDQVAQAFCHANVTLIDDSGPPMSDAYMTTCLQARWAELWNLDGTLPADCSDCRRPDGSGLSQYLPYIINKYPKAKLTLISANMDGIISLFFGYGQNNCQGLDGTSAGMSGVMFQAGLEELRTTYLSESSNLGTYIVPSTSHTWLNGLAFYGTTVSGMALPEWVNLLMNQGVATHVDP